MIDINLTDLVEHLDPACRNALVGAAGECVARGHYEMAIEHALLLMIEQPDAELRGILAAYELDPARLRSCLHEGLAAFAQGHTGRPVFSPLLIEWLMEAWLICSIEKRRGTIGSTALWTALAVRAERYVNSATARLLQYGGLTSLPQAVWTSLPRPRRKTAPGRPHPGRTTQRRTAPWPGSASTSALRRGPETSIRCSDATPKSVR